MAPQHPTGELGRGYVARRSALGHATRVVHASAEGPARSRVPRYPVEGFRIRSKFGSNSERRDRRGRSKGDRRREIGAEIDRILADPRSTSPALGTRDPTWAVSETAELHCINSPIAYSLERMEVYVVRRSSRSDSSSASSRDGATMRMPIRIHARILSHRTTRHIHNKQGTGPS